MACFVPASCRAMIAPGRAPASARVVIDDDVEPDSVSPGFTLHITVSMPRAASVDTTVAFHAPYGGRRHVGRRPVSASTSGTSGSTSAAICAAVDFERSRWVIVWSCTVLPSATARRTRSGFDAAHCPTTKKVATAPCAASVSRMPGVICGLGPSSNVSATTGLPGGFGWPGMSKDEKAGLAAAPARGRRRGRRAIASVIASATDARPGRARATPLLLPRPCWHGRQRSLATGMPDTAGRQENFVCGRSRCSPSTTRSTFSL